MPETVNLRSARLALVAGNGNLPLQVADALAGAGRDYRIVAIKGEAERETCSRADKELGWGEIGQLYKFLKASGCGEVLLIGGVTKRPDFASIMGDVGTLLRLPKILKALKSGDDSLLTKVIRLFEDEGYSVVGINDVAPQLLAGEGVLGAVRPKERDLKDLHLALSATKKLGELDVGQAAVALEGRVIALEGAEGTDAMLERCAELKRLGRISRKSGVGVLVKTAKPKQDLRVDLPTVGPKTVDLAASAGLAGIAVEAGGALIADKEETLERANTAGLFVVGIEPGKDNGLNEQ